MKRLKHSIAGILTASLLACGQEQSDDSEKTASEAGNKSGLSSLLISKQNPSASSATTPENHDKGSAARGALAHEASSQVIESLVSSPEWTTLSEKKRKRAIKEVEKDQKRALKRASHPAPRPLSDYEKNELTRKRQQMEQADAVAARKNFDSEDDTIRREALLDLDPDDAGDLKRLMSALISDPDPAIREEIAGMLSFGDYQAAVPVLLKSLSDPEPKVVISAMEALSWYGGNDKESIVAAINNLKTNHFDTQVKEAAKTALDTME